MNTTFLLITPYINISVGYFLGAIIALFVFGYLLYSLVKPEKF
jgi:K+-transporting ATPase KdpF subunit